MPPTDNDNSLKNSWYKLTHFFATAFKQKNQAKSNVVATKPVEGASHTHVISTGDIIQNLKEHPPLVRYAVQYPGYFYMKDLYTLDRQKFNHLEPEWQKSFAKEEELFQTDRGNNQSWLEILEIPRQISEEVGSLYGIENEKSKINLIKLITRKYIDFYKMNTTDVETLNEALKTYLHQKHEAKATVKGIPAPLTRVEVQKFKQMDNATRNIKVFARQSEGKITLTGEGHKLMGDLYQLYLNTGDETFFKKAPLAQRLFIATQAPPGNSHWLEILQVPERAMKMMTERYENNDKPVVIKELSDYYKMDAKDREKLSQLIEEKTFARLATISPPADDEPSHFNMK